MSGRAKDIMTSRFLRISTQHSIGEALGLLLYGEQKKMDTGAIVVIDVEGDFAGLLTPGCILRGLGESADPDVQTTGENFIGAVNARLSQSIESAMRKDLVTVGRDTPLSRLIYMMGMGDMECLPVMEENRVVGLIYVTDLFRATANLALTPGSEGIFLNQ